MSRSVSRTEIRYPHIYDEQYTLFKTHFSVHRFKVFTDLSKETKILHLFK